MDRIYIFLIVLMAFSCTGTGQRKQPESEVVEEQKPGKLEQLMLLPRDSVMEHYDLSNDSIADFPDLSDYTIKSLDLSYNRLDTVVVEYLPKGIIALNLSNNLLRNILRLKFDHKKELTLTEEMKLYEKTTIQELDLSHNRLTGINIWFHLRKIDISHNDITYINFSHRNIEYIDISNNLNLSNTAQFDPNKIDTIIRDNIANDKKLVPSNWDPPHINYIILDDSIK